MINILFNVPRELKHASGIYKISNNIDNRIYVGRTNDFKKRYFSHKYSFAYLNGKIKRFVDLNPDACFFFSVVEVTNNLKKAEEYWINKLKSVENGFNRFSSDEEFLNFHDNCVYKWKIDLKKTYKERKHKKTLIVKKTEIPKKKKKKAKKQTRNKYPLGLIVINGIKYDLLGNRLPRCK